MRIRGSAEAPIGLPVSIFAPGERHGVDSSLIRMIIAHPGAARLARRTLTHIAERDKSDYTELGNESPFSGERHGDCTDSHDHPSVRTRMEGRARGNTPPSGSMERGRVSRSDGPPQPAGRVHRRVPGNPPHAYGQAPRRFWGSCTSLSLASSEPRGGKVRFSPLRLQIRPGKFREPDLLLLLSAADPRRQNRFWLGADLALEVVSEEKPERDLVDKRGDYAEGRVPEYWIVNPQTETITVLHLRGDAYEEAGIYRRGESAGSTLLAGFSVAVAAVFDAD